MKCFKICLLWTYVLPLRHDGSSAILIFCIMILGAVKLQASHTRKSYSEFLAAACNFGFLFWCSFSFLKVYASDITNCNTPSIIHHKSNGLSCIANVHIQWTSLWTHSNWNVSINKCP
jgi:hypothetical protein